MSPSSESALYAQLNAIRRRWPVGLITAATVVALAAPVAMGLPNLYRAGATLKVDQPPDPVNAATTNPLVGVNARLETIRQEVLSRQRVMSLAEEMNIYPELRQAGQIDSVVATMQRDVKVDQLNASRGDGRVTTVSFRVTYTGNDPAKVAAVANRLAAYYVERSGAIRSRQASRNTDALRTELADTARRLDAQDKRVMDYTRDHAGSLPSQMSTVATRISQLTTSLQTNTAEITRVTDQYEGGQRQMAALLTPSGAVDQTDPAIRLAQARRDLDTLLISFREPSIQVRTKRSEIEALEKLVASRAPAAGTEAASSPLTTLREQMAGWQARLDVLRKANADLQAELARNEAILAAAPVRSVEFDRLTAEAQQTRTLYNSLSTRFQEAQAGERAQTGQSGQEFEILDPAVQPDSASAPDRQLLLGAVGVLALVLGLALVLALDYFDRSFRSVDELRAFTHVPVLATIPRVVSRRTRTRRILVGAVTGAAVSVVLGVVSIGVFQLARQAEPITRLLLR